MKTRLHTPQWQKFYPYILIVGGLLGLFAALSLSLDEIKLLKNPGFQPICNLNPLLSCTSVISSHQAKAFANVPNPYIGLAGFAIVITVGMGILAGAKFKKWFWQGLLLGTTFGVSFVHWLIFQSVYNIGKLCLYCMLVWVATIALFWYTLLYNLREGHIKTPAPIKKLVDFAQKNHVGILFLWYLTIAVLIVHRFWYFFGPQ